MIKKQGITVTVMVITVIILIILAGTITFSVYSTVNYSRISTWATEMIYVQEVVDENLNISSTTDFTNGSILLDISDMSANEKEEQLYGETIAEDNTISLNILDLAKLKIVNTMYGNLDTQEDVYAVSPVTGKVYYVQGMEINNTIYFALTESLKARYNLASSAGNLTSVVFVPSKLGYSNEPIAVTVKVPNTYTNIAISVSNTEIQIGSQVAKENTYEYLVNSNNVTGNYTITVSYNDGTQTLTSKYEVNGYDIIVPVIQPITDENFVYKKTDTSVICYVINIAATDESGIKNMKYELGTIEESKAKEYFKQNGKFIVDGKINIDSDIEKYTIYAEDNAGNFVITTLNAAKLKGWTKKGFTLVKGNQVLNIGDVVNYDEGVDTYTAGWKVLGTDEKGNLLIMSAADIKSGYKLSSKDFETAQNEWLNSGLEKLNNECKPYGKGEGAIGVRSITLEDIDEVTGYDKTTYESGNTSEYNNKLTFIYNSTVRPAYKASNKRSGKLLNDHTAGLYWYNEDGFGHTTAEELTNTSNADKEIVTITTNYYGYAGTSKLDESTDAYKMLFGTSDSYNSYFLATQYTLGTYSYINYGFTSVHEGYVSAYYMWNSLGDGNEVSRGIRAVVTLSKEINFTGSSETGWSY